MSALSDVLIGDRGGGNPVRLSLAELSVGWAVNEIGLLSGIAPTADLFATGLRDIRGKRLTYEHPTAGRWEGRITTPAWGPRTVEVVAESMASYLRRRRTARTARPDAAPAGALFARLMADLATDDPLPLGPAGTDGDGDPITVEWRAEDAWDVTRRLVEDGGMEFRVNDDREPEFRVRVGRDVSDAVLLADGAGGAVVGEYAWVEDLWTVENDLLGIGGDDLFAAAAATAVEDGVAIRALGRFQGSRAYPDLGSGDAIEARLRQELARRKDGTSTVRLTTVDAGGVWAGFREGDSVRVSLGGASALLRARVMIRTLDLARGTMEIAADVEAVLAR